MQRLRELAESARAEIVRISYGSHSGHIGSSLSSIDLLVGLYAHLLRLQPDGARDRFILSKGHASAALYVCLQRAGFFDQETLEGFGKDGGTLRHHPDRKLEWGIEVTSGSLGHGLSLAAGMAYASKLKGENWRAVALMSDGELAEGTVWEAALFAAHHQLDALVGIVDCNKIQAMGETKNVLQLEDLVKKWEAFGWGVRRIDGHDMGQIVVVLDAIPFVPAKPSMIIADTVKGKGVSFMEGKLLWHYRCPDDKEYKCAMKELESDENDGD